MRVGQRFHPGRTALGGQRGIAATELSDHAAPAPGHIERGGRGGITGGGQNTGIGDDGMPTGQGRRVRILLHPGHFLWREMLSGIGFGKRLDLLGTGLGRHDGLLIESCEIVDGKSLAGFQLGPRGADKRESSR